MNAILSLWKTDAQDLCALVSGYVPAQFAMWKDKVLAEESKAHAEALCSEDGLARLQKASKGISMLTAWRKCVLKINADGCGVFFEPTMLNQIQQVVGEALAFHTCATNVRRIRVELPGVRNVPNRQSKAKEYLKDAPEYFKDAFKSIAEGSAGGSKEAEA